MQLKQLTVEDFSTYLTEKYHQSFVFFQQGIDAWSSRYSTAIFKNAGGEKFQVRYSEDGFIDNFATLLFDKDIEERFMSAISCECKLFANTRTFYSGANELFSDCDDYLASTPAISIRVYVKEKDINSQLMNQMLKVIPDSLVTCTVTVVADGLYADIDRNSETPKGDKVLDRYSFSLKNGNIVNQSWEG